MSNDQLFKWGGPPPYGYLFDNKSRSLSIIEEEAATIKLIYQLAEEGKSPNQIAQFLNNRNIKTQKGVLWRHGSITYLMRPDRMFLYAGFDKNGNRGNWQPIITRQYVDNLIAKGVAMSKTQGWPHIHVYLLPGLGIAKCGYCGSTIKTAVSSKRGHVDRYYRCTNKSVRGHKACPESMMRRQEDVDDIILSDIRDHFLHKKKIQKYTRDAESVKKAKLAGIIKKQESEIKQAVDSSDAKKLEELPEKIKNLRLLVEEAKHSFDFTGLQNLSNKPVEEQRIFMQKLINKITIYNEKIIIEYKFCISPNNYKKEINVGIKRKEYESVFSH